MTVEDKLSVHLLHVVMPLGVPLTAKQQLELCDKADRAQRQAAIDRSRVRSPFLLPDEETEARMWLEQIGWEDLRND